jgi:hypothetical protein
MTPMTLRTPSAFVATFIPDTSAVPDVGGMSVVSMRMRVDFPAPFGPRRPKISPRPTENEISSTAVKSPNRLTMR